MVEKMCRKSSPWRHIPVLNGGKPKLMESSCLVDKCASATNPSDGRTNTRAEMGHKS